MQKRSLIFVGLCVICAAGLGWLFTHSAAPPPPAPETSLPEPAPSVAIQPAAAAPASETAQRIFFRSTNPEQHYGELAYVELAALSAPKFLNQWSCESVYVAGGMGSCLTADRGVFTTYTASIFDAAFKKLFAVPLNGIPSRTRVSPNGKFAAVTVFVTGHGYDSVDFTTQTSLIDTSTGKILADMETFAVSKDGQAFEAKDFNFWGVTFAPDNDRFYSTLSSNRKHYLIEGSVKARTAHVIHENVECPSLSPDATRVAYKKRLPGDRVVWQLHVLDLKTLGETSLAERRSVDDQLEWLDNERVLYSLPHSETPGPSTDVWVASADGKGKPRLFLPNAYSPSVTR
jgi:hypothetical protein